MMRIVKELAVVIVCAASVAAAGGQPLTEHTRERADGEPAPACGIGAAAFLEGRWVCEALGGTVEEIWAAPAGGAMMGMFRLIKDGEPAFYELFVLQEEEGSLVLRLKHFDGRTFHGWEEREQTVDFPLVAVEGDTLFLSGLTYERTGPDRLTAYLAMRGKGGVREVVFPYSRVGP